MGKSTKGMAGSTVADTYLSRVDGLNGELIYRGYNILELGVKASFEEVVYLLWNGELPNEAELAAFKAKMAAKRALPEAAKVILTHFPKNAHPMAVLRTVVSYLGALDDDAENISLESSREKAELLTAVTPTIVAAFERIRQGKEPIEPRTDLDHAANFLYMLSGEEPSAEATDAVDAYLVLLADHGFNASTFASRVTTGTLSDMYSAVTSGLGTLKGSAHGGANQKAMEQFISADKRGDTDAWYQETRANGQRIMGIGHRVYKAADPRGTILKPLAKKLAASSGESKWVDIAERIDENSRNDDYFVSRNLFANVDFYSAVVLYTLGIPFDQFTCLFAMSRMAGWTAHVIEQVADNRLIRPKAQYVGAEPRAFVAVENR